MYERVVETLDIRAQHARAVEIAAAQQPQFLLLADVRQVPHQRAHQGVVLAAQFGIVEIDQPQGALACPRQVASQLFPYAHISPCARRATVGAMPWPITWSEKSSAGQRPCSTAWASRCIASSRLAGTRSAAAATHRLAAA